MTAPQRAQRVRGIPGVGLRTPGGREWLRWGKGHRWDPDTPDALRTDTGWVIARCTHKTGAFIPIPKDDPNRWMLDVAWETCTDCCELGLLTFTVRSCTRPGKYGNPWRTARRGDRWVVEWSSYESFMRYPTEQAATECVLLTFRSRVMMWPDEYFEDLARYDYLSCWCPLDGPCHVDEILAEGRRRGVWQ